MTSTPLDDALLPEPDLDTVLRVSRLLMPLSLYHRHTVKDLDRLPRTGPWMLVMNHSLATYDGFLFGTYAVRHLQRVPRALGDKRIFQTPALRDFAHAIGIVEASPDAGMRLLRAGQIIGVAPGGMWEALRPRDERYRVRWEERRGFVRLALQAGAPIVVASCPAADDLYDVYGSRLTDLIYERLHLPVPLARGLGPTLLPRPVKLTHYIAEPIVPPRHDPAHEDEQVEELHARACAAMAGLMTRR